MLLEGSNPCDYTGDRPQNTKRFVIQNIKI